MHDPDNMCHCEISLITCGRTKADQWDVWWFKVALALWLIVLSLHHGVTSGLSAPCPRNALPPSSNTSLSSVVAPFRIALQIITSSERFGHMKHCLNPTNPLMNNRRHRPYLSCESKALVYCLIFQPCAAKVFSRRQSKKISFWSRKMKETMRI